MKIMKKFNLLIAVLFFCSIAFAQEAQETEPQLDQTEEQPKSKKEKKILPIRIGLKLGTPNGIGGNLEYVTPLLQHRIAVYGDYSVLNAEVEDADNNFKYYEFGTNIYFSKNKGRGLYGSFGYGVLNINSTGGDYETDDGDTITNSKADFNVETLNVKLGLKLGRRVYFRTELGYGFGEIPQEIIVTGTINDTPAQEVVDISEDISEIPGISENGYLIFNIGFGIGF